MTTTYVYPSNAVLNEVAQVLEPQLTMDDLLFELMPIEEMDADIIMWEQEDDFIGLQQARGINGEPPKVQPTGAKTYIMQPGVYGEYLPIDEKALTSRRQYGTHGTPVDISDLIAHKQNQLLSRRIDRIRYIGWTLLTTGTFSVAHPNGVVIHTDQFPLSLAAGSDWTNPATATPLADFRTLQLNGPEQGTNYGSRAKAIMNRKTANYLLANTNQADLGGKRTAGLANMLSLSDINTLNAGEDLPQIEIYDKGYRADNGVFTRFVADRKVVIVGERPANAPVARYFMTRNAQNPDAAPGAYMMVYDSITINKPPREIQVHDGHNGGPAIFYPGSITILSV